VYWVCVRVWVWVWCVDSWLNCLCLNRFVTQTIKEGPRQTDRQTDKQTGRETEKSIKGREGKSTLRGGDGGMEGWVDGWMEGWGREGEKRRKAVGGAGEERGGEGRGRRGQ